MISTRKRRPVVRDFFVLLRVLHASEREVHTGWFIESIPLSPFARGLGFVPLPGAYYVFLVAATSRTSGSWKW